MKIKKLSTVLLCGLFVLIMSVWCFSGKTPDYSESERRLLASFPKITVDSVMSGDFAGDFEKYATERFPLRDSWRSLKAYTRLYAFMQKDNNGLYTAQGHLSKLIYPMETEKIDYAAELFTKVKEANFNDSKVYLTVIPDKNMFLAKDNGYLSMDYSLFTEYMKDKMSYAEYIEVSDLLSAEDYYYTDTHWRQDKITDVAERIVSAMGNNTNQSFTENVLEHPFNGVYVGQSALMVTPDTITYLTNNTIDALEVEGASAVYDMEKAVSRDPYEMFLSGTQPVVKIMNPNNTSGDRLVVFRDSFGSSIAPLMADAYSEIVLVDLRYINSSLLNQYVDFSDADILFMYSTMMLNDSLAMK